jgi:hypothetical protein
LLEYTFTGAGTGNKIEDLVQGFILNMETEEDPSPIADLMKSEVFLLI